MAPLASSMSTRWSGRWRIIRSSTPSRSRSSPAGAPAAHRVQAAVGRAGTGKTTTMRVAATAWRNAGYRVIGCAVKGEAARQLAVDAGIDADTVALLLTHSRHGSPSSTRTPC